MIEIDSNKLVILSTVKKNCVTIPIQDIRRFSLKYAKTPQYGWSIPVYSLATLSHGFLLGFTLPINLITTIIVTNTGEKSFKYNEKNFSFDQLKMFARYPQGIPEHISLDMIK